MYKQKIKQYVSTFRTSTHIYFLFQEDINVVIVGWGGGSDSWLWNYDKSASNTRVVARETALIVENLINNGGSTYDKMWCVGHSLGSHVCGILGMETLLGRVTGKWRLPKGMDTVICS